MRRILSASLAIIVTIFALSITGEAMDIVPSEPFLAQQASSQARTQVELTKEVRHELMMLPYFSLFDWLEYRIEDETVILSGQVTRPTLKSDAERVVSKIKGVEKVDNQIEVLPLSPNDDRIRRAVYRAIFNFNGPLFQYSMGVAPSIHIIVKNGNVTLKGVVEKQSDSNLATIRANGVSGVFSVKNELIVEEP